MAHFENPGEINFCWRLQTFGKSNARNSAVHVVLTTEFFFSHKYLDRFHVFYFFKILEKKSFLLEPPERLENKIDWFAWSMLGSNPIFFIISSNRPYFVRYFIFNIFFFCMVGTNFQKFAKNPKMNFSSRKFGSGGLSTCSFELAKFRSNRSRAVEKVPL